VASLSVPPFGNPSSLHDPIRGIHQMPSTRLNRESDPHVIHRVPLSTCTEPTEKGILGNDANQPRLLRI